jgi:hypothetical protein
MVYCEEQVFEFEKHMQTLIENNLSSFSQLELVQSESWIKNFRIDTLAFNHKLNCFAIIEYKRKINFSIIDQGISYLKMLNQNKAEFVLKYNDKFKNRKIRSEKDINWRKCYVIFAAPDFTEHQKNAACWKDLKIILWRVKLYGNSILTISELSRLTPPEEHVIFMPAEVIEIPALPQKIHITKNVSSCKNDGNWSTEELWKEIKIIGKRN